MLTREMHHGKRKMTTGGWKPPVVGKTGMAGEPSPIYHEKRRLSNERKSGNQDHSQDHVL